MSLGIILIHGYTGSHQDLKPLADELIANFGKESVINLSLPGHELGKAPQFDEQLFIDTIYRSINIFQNEGRKIVIIGHSTGGNIALGALIRYPFKLELLILISVPQKVDGSYFERWEQHRADKPNIPLVEVAMMVKFINSTGSKRFACEFPVLVIHGENDRLVPCSQAHLWNSAVFAKPARVVTIPQADHDIFQNANSHLVTDIILRTIRDTINSNITNMGTINSLIEVDPDFKDFVATNPFSKHHLALCPSSQLVVEKKPKLLPTAANDPVIANIEITTYCNLKCQFCARTRLKKSNQHMSFDLFRNILSLLPNIYKIVLVGLGEPLLHPQLIELIKYAKSLNKKVALVTNAMLLETEISNRVLEAGLDSIAFSLDGSNLNLSSIVRNGTDFDKVIHNIKEFVRISNSSRKIPGLFFPPYQSTLSSI